MNNDLCCSVHPAFFARYSRLGCNENPGPSRPNLTRQHDDAHVHQPSTFHRENTGPPTADTGPGTVPHQRPARDGRDEG